MGLGSKLIIGIAGGTGSGKTTLANELAQEFEEDLTVLSHDDYYCARHELSYGERAALNYDHPGAYETELLVHHLKQLKEGRDICVPVYDFAQYDRTERVRVVHPTSVIVVEGIMIFDDSALRSLLDVKVFVDAPADVRFLRRALRDVEERGRTLKSVATQYLGTVRPMHERFVEPSKRHADVIVSSERSTEVVRDLLACRVREQLRKA